MKTTYLIAILLTSLLCGACGRNHAPADAYGNFEADETLVSALMPGELVSFAVTEGDRLDAGVAVGLVDTVGLYLRRLEAQASRKATASQAENIAAELEVLQDQLANLTRERNRAANLITAGAATTKQLDDLDGEIAVVKSRMKSVGSQNATVQGQVAALDARIRQIDEDIRKSRVVNPVAGVVLAKLAEPGEFVAPGRTLYRIADTTQLNLRAFVGGPQLAGLELGATYEVRIDGPDGKPLAYPGTVTWIADEAEFTPKTVQTRKQRQDLVYAVKVRVANDGRIKIGMPGELWLTPPTP